MTSGKLSLRAVTPHGLLVERLRAAEATFTSDPAAAARHLRAALDLGEGLEDYVGRCTTPSAPELEALAERTRSVDWTARFESQETVRRLEAEMLSGHVEGQFLAFLAGISKARRALEIGMFTGHGSLALALAMGPGSEVVALEIDPATAELARQTFKGSEAGDRIEIRVGPALQSLDELRNKEPFDLVFIDADKTEYEAYLDKILGGLLTDDGLVVVDNTLLQGEPYAPGGPPSPAGQAIRAFNERVRGDPRVEQVILPLRDGVTLIRRARGR